MFRRTFLAFAGAAAALRTKVLGQSRGELNRMAEEQLAATPFKAEAIMSLDVGGLASVLQDPAATDFAKAKACQRLAVVGDESAVPALEALLGSARLSHYARTALEPLPGAAADAALRARKKGSEVKKRNEK